MAKAQAPAARALPGVWVLLAFPDGGEDSKCAQSVEFREMPFP